MAQLAPQSCSYRVEVSGWDITAAFFSEKTALYGSAAGQEIALRSRLREGMLIFVRLLEPFAREGNFPVTYVVEKTLPVEIDGRVTFMVTKLEPKPSCRQSVAIVGDSRANCA